MSYILIALVLPIVAVLLVYFLYPRMLFNLGRDALRRRGKMTVKSIQVGGDIWPYMEGGPADAETIILLHGFGGDKDAWSLYAPHLTDRYRLICPDLPGFGDNTRDFDREYGFAPQAERLKDFMDAMNIDAAHIGGNSMGGGISLRFAHQFPAYTRSLTVFNNAGVVGTIESDLQQKAMQGQNPLEITSADDVNRMMAYIAAKPIKVPGQFRKVIYQDFAKYRELLQKIFWQLVENGLNAPMNDDLKTVTLPTMIIWGRHDQLIHYSSGEVMHAEMPNSEMVIFEDLGHVPMMESPVKVATRHREFLAKHSGQDPNAIGVATLAA